MNGRSKLDPARKIQLYKAVLRPTVTYASAVWATAAKTHRIKIQTFQNRMLRWALDAPWFVRNTTLHEDAHHGLYPEHRNPFLRQSKGSREPAGVEITRVRLQDPLEVPPPKVTHRGQSGLNITSFVLIRLAPTEGGLSSWKFERARSRRRILFYLDIAPASRGKSPEPKVD
ncbi:hypothetical protein Trydic_g13449 [Trypoxylus dichotomus]